MSACMRQMNEICEFTRIQKGGISLKTNRLFISRYRRQILDVSFKIRRRKEVQDLNIQRGYSDIDHPNEQRYV